MKKNIHIILVIILVISTFSSINVYSKTINSEIEKKQILEEYDQFEGAYKYNTQGWIYLYIHGDAYERGFQHGSLLTDEIVDMINRWAHIINNHPNVKAFVEDKDQETYDKVAQIWWDFCKKSIEKHYWDNFPEEYKQEIKGIADAVAKNGGKIFGKNISYQDILASNEMYVYLSKITEFKMGIHPLRTLFGELRRAIDQWSVSELSFILGFVAQPPVHHCSGFIAAGNATTHGQIVITDSMWCGRGSWWWTFYISMRWNLILDINPTHGNRIVMSSAPGFIWSDHDYYQNDNGICFIETTLDATLWDHRGIPISVRARNAVQYGDSIDEVLDYLITDSDGGLPAVWLIGDCKTGEIARLDLGLYKHGVWRTFNGFYWSANNPIDPGVRMEKFKLGKGLYYIYRYIFENKDGYEYYLPKYRPASRDIAFEDLGNKYYGQIDIEKVKEIMSTPPICGASTDCKLSDSDMINNSGLWAYLGKLTGKTLELENYDKTQTSTELIPPMGWTKIYGIPEGKEDFTVLKNMQNKNVEPEVLWEQIIDEKLNNFKTRINLVEDELILTANNNMLYSMDPDTGEINYNMSVGDSPTIPVKYQNKIFIGTNSGLLIYDSLWDLSGMKNIGQVVSEPVVFQDSVIVGNIYGDIYSYNISDGELLWQIKIPGMIYISEPDSSNVFVCSGNKTYKIDAVEGQIIWNYTANHQIDTVPVVYDNSVFFGSWDNYFYSIDKNTGELIWKNQTGWGIVTKACVSEDMVYLGSLDHNMYAFDKNTGKTMWVFTSNSSIHSSPVIVNNSLVFGSDDGRLYYLNKTDGNLQWSFSPGFTIKNHKNYATTPIRSNIIEYNDNIIIGAKGSIFLLKS